MKCQYLMSNKTQQKLRYGGIRNKAGRKKNMSKITSGNLHNIHRVIQAIKKKNKNRKNVARMQCSEYLRI